MVINIDHEEYDQGLQELQRQLARDRLRIIVARAETTEFASIADGVTKENVLEWERATLVRAANFERVVVVKTAGTCTSFDVEVRTKAGGTGLDVVYQFLAAPGSILDKIPDPAVPFLSEQTGADKHKIHLAVTPHGGDGTFKARIYASPRR